MTARRRALRFLPALLVMSAIFWFSATPAEPLMQVARPLIQRAPQSVAVPLITRPVSINWLKVGHFVGYFLLGGALLYAFAPLARRPALPSLLVVALYAVSDEIHQVFVPGRHAGWQDVLIDAGAAGVAIGVIGLVKVVGKQGKKEPGRA